MALKNENLFGLIENTSNFLNMILFTGLKIDLKDYENFEENLDFKKELQKYIEEKQFKQGNDLLFEKIKEKDYGDDMLRVGAWFFFKLNNLDEEKLKEGGFEKRDIADGMKKIEEYVFRKN